MPELTTIPHCSVDDVFSQHEGEGVTEYLVEYLKPFAKPIIDQREGDGFMIGKLKCLKCGKALDGFLGSFSWGIAHGEGRCSCGWPARLYHYLKLPDGTEGRISLMLQYHPDFVEERKNA